MKMIAPFVTPAPTVHENGLVVRTPSPFVIASHHLTSTNVTETDFTGYSIAESVTVGTQRQVTSWTATVTLTIANPCVVTWTRNLLFENDIVRLTTTGTLPTGLTAGNIYYAVNVTPDTFQLAAKPDGLPIITTGSQSGTHTAAVTTHSVYEALKDSCQMTASISGTTLTVTAIATGALAVGMYLYGTSVATYQRIKSFITGTGGTGDYELDISEPTIGSRTMHGRAPQTMTDHWARIGSTNPWKMHDSSPAGQTSRVGTIVNKYTIDGGRVVDAIVFLNVSAETIQVVVTDGGAGVVYNTTKTTETASTITGETERHNTVMFLDLPTAYTNVVIDVTLTATGENVLCGGVVFGKLWDWGNTQYGMSLENQDYSQKIVDSYGNYSIQEGAFSKKVQLTAHIVNTDIDLIFDKLSLYRATPAVYIGSETYRASVAFGFASDWGIEVTYPQDSFISVEIEGLGQ